jgi:hypothetical protein
VVSFAEWDDLDGWWNGISHLPFPIVVNKSFRRDMLRVGRRWMMEVGRVSYVVLTIALKS